MKIINNYIGNAFIPPLSNEYLDVICPYNKSVVAKVARSNTKDLEQAIKIGEKARESWALTSLKERSELLMEMASLIEKNKDELAELESLNTGKPLSLAKSLDIPRAITNFQFFARLITDNSRSSHWDHEALHVITQNPLGHVATISPWNLPLYLFTWKIAPALATGNIVYAKVSEVTPLTTHFLCELFKKSSFPLGVFNCLHGLGSEIGDAMVKAPQIKAISFTGGTQTGKTIAQSASVQLKKVSFELGGKNAGIVFPDCHFDEMIEGILKSSYTNQGQVCLCTSRLFIHEDLYDKFKQVFVERVQSLKVGDPFHEETQIGPVINQTQFEKIKHYLFLAKENGGKVLCGGNSTNEDQGFFIQPTVIEGLENDDCCNQEEIFGPVVTLQKFKDENEVIKKVNQSDYGLCSSLWTQNIQRATRMAQKIETGMVWVNTWALRDLHTPFGGHKMSGLGREGGKLSLDFFTEPKTVTFKMGGLS